MKIINDGKLFGKLNIIDVILLIIILVILVGIVIKLTDKDVASSITNPSDVFEYTMQIKNVRYTTPNVLKVGDVVYDKVSGKEIGKIVNVISQIAQIDMELFNGSIEKREIENKVDIVLSIETNGTIKNNEYLANGLIKILKGSNLVIHTKYLEVMGVITDIKAEE